jgi:ABC-type uncharacterized transport system substrate-binding protein
MRRRDVISFTPLAALIPLAAAPAIGQPVSPPKRLGWLAVQEMTAGPRVFEETLRRLGWKEGQDLIIERRYVGNGDAYAQAAAELAAAKPDVLVGVGAADIVPLIATTKTIPIVFCLVADPVAGGFVTSLRSPGGNVTGIASMSAALEPKQLQLLHELLPQAKRILMLRDPRQPGTDAHLIADQAAAPSLGLELVIRKIGSAASVDAAFAAVSGVHVQAVHVEFSGRVLRHKERIVRHVSSARLPAIYGARAFVDAGGLVSYGALYLDNFRRAAVLVDKILRGAKPADLPVEEPTRFELVLNLKAARSLGLSIPQSILVRADEVIE